MCSFSGLGVFGVFSQHFTRRAFLGAVSLAAAASVAHAQTAEITGSITSIAPKLAVAGKASLECAVRALQESMIFIPACDD